MLLNHNFYDNKSSDIMSNQYLSFDTYDIDDITLSYPEVSMEVKETLIQSTSSSTGLVENFSLSPNQYVYTKTINGSDYTLLTILKSYSKDSINDGYRDSRIFTTSNPILRNGCNCIKICGYTWNDYSSDLTCKVYVKATSSPLDDVPSNTQYDFSEWTQITSSTLSSGSECEAIVPIEIESDSFYVNIGIYHGTETSVCTVWFGIKELYLVQLNYI